MRIEEKETMKKYNLSAEAYHYWRTEKYPHGWFFNELLEMPATLELLGNVKGKNVLDFGCGTGIYAKLLTKKGAKLKGFDLSKEMLSIAKRENPGLDLKLGSGYKIPFKQKFDIVYSALVVHHLKDWDKMFKEVSRVLKKGGYFIFSTGNPVSEVREKVMFKGKKISIEGDYFKERKLHGNWRDNGGKKMEMTSYHMTYETIIRTILRNKFEIVDYRDCFPDKKAKKTFPSEYERYSKQPFFCVWKLKKK